MKKLFSKLTSAFGATGNRKTGFVYPPSVQSDLFNYLKPKQQNILRPILRVIKRPYQADLCVSLLDYLEGNGNRPTGNTMLDRLRQSIIEVCELHPMR